MNLQTSVSLDAEVFIILLWQYTQNIQGGVPESGKVELKQPIVQAIAEEIKDAQSVVLVDYRGLTVAQDTELRKQLREAGIVYKVYKNTMMKRAFEGTEFEGLDNCLEGPSAIAVSKDDATAPARILCKFAKDAPALELKGGVVEGTVYDVAGLTELSKIPSREELLSRLLEVCSHRLQTSHVLSSRSLRKTARQQRLLRQRRQQLRLRQQRQLRLQKHRQQKQQRHRLSNQCGGRGDKCA